MITSMIISLLYESLLKDPFFKRHRINIILEEPPPPALCIGDDSYSRITVNHPLPIVGIRIPPNGIVINDNIPYQTEYPFSIFDPADPTFTIEKLHANIRMRAEYMTPRGNRDYRIHRT